ncbi:MAG: extracellular solute-binding protein [Candidatus Lustribacter sp.]|jgi:iron(III) transport system substrate-binding protein
MRRRHLLAGALAAAAAARTRPALAQNDALKALVEAAKAEGSVVVDGPPIDTCRQAIVEGFQSAYGIPVSYISSGSSASGARVRAERAAGKYLLDVFVSGGDTPPLTFLPAGWLDRVEPVLVEPDVVDKRKWKDGHLWYLDPDHTILRTLQFVTPELVVNTKLVKPGEVTTWHALLDPKWQGKIVAKDPGVSGAGTSLIAMLYIQFGPDFVRRLYRDQKPTISRDARQAAQFVAQGNYALLLGPDATAVDTFKQQGYPIDYVFPTDAPSVLSGGWGLFCLMNKAPHPNAAKLFINWLAGPAGQAAFARSVLSVSLRTDIKYTDMPAWAFPKSGTKYLDTYDYKFVTAVRDPAVAKARDLLGE